MPFNPTKMTEAFWVRGSYTAPDRQVQKKKNDRTPAGQIYEKHRPNDRGVKLAQKKGSTALFLNNAPQTTLCLCLLDHSPYCNNRFSQILDLDLM